MKRISALMTVLTLLFCGAASAAETTPAETTAAEDTLAETARQIEMKNVPVFLAPGVELPGGFPLYFADGVEDLAYVNLSDWADFLNIAYSDDPHYEGFTVTADVDEAANLVMLTRGGNHRLLRDSEKKGGEINPPRIRAFCGAVDRKFTAP